MDKVEISRAEVLEYFNNLLTDKETWKGNKKQRKTMASTINGALVFANLFGLITRDEKNAFIAMKCE